VAASDLITSKFSKDSTADDVIAGIDLLGHRAIVTGASSCIGVETARALAAAGAEVTLAVRNMVAGEPGRCVNQGPQWKFRHPR
jgi:hypothetical protein